METAHTADELKKECETLKKMIKSYENIMRLSDREIANAEEIIRMYERMVELSTLEIHQLKQTIKANELVSQFSDTERQDQQKKIDDLIAQNKKLKEERSEIR